MTAADLPAPLIPASLVLPGIQSATQVSFDFDYVDGLPRDPGVYLICFGLYASSYKQCPTGSLPSDERSLRALIRPTEQDIDWAPVAEALSPRWVRCSDGRLYRPQLAESVLTTWLELALMPAAVDAMSKAALLPDVVQCLRRLKPRAEILDRVAAASGDRAGADADYAQPDDYDAVAAVAAADLARNLKGSRR